MKKLSIITILILLTLVSCTSSMDKYDIIFMKADSVTNVFLNSIKSENVDSVLDAFDKFTKMDLDTTFLDTVNMSESQFKEWEAVNERRNKAFDKYADFIKGKRGEVLMGLEIRPSIGSIISNLVAIGLDYTFEQKTGYIVTGPFTYRGISIENAVFYSPGETCAQYIGFYASEESNSLKTLENIPNVVDSTAVVASFLGVETGLNEVWIFTDYYDLKKVSPELINIFNETLDLSKAGDSYPDYMHLKTNHIHVSKEEWKKSEQLGNDAFRRIVLGK